MVNALELDDVFAGSRALVIFSTLSFPSLVAFSSSADMARLTAESVSLRAQPQICVNTLQTSELRCGLSFSETSSAESSSFCVFASSDAFSSVSL